MSEQQETFELMTDEQVANFRRILSMMIGPYALLAPRHDIVEIRDYLQTQANKMKEDVS